MKGAVKGAVSEKGSTDDTVAIKRILAVTLTAKTEKERDKERKAAMKVSVSFNDIAPCLLFPFLIVRTPLTPQPHIERRQHVRSPRGEDLT